MQVFNAQTVDAASVDFKHFGGSSGLMNLYVSGDLGGGTLTVEAELPDEGGYVPVTGGEITTAGMHVISAAPFVGRLSLAGSTSASVSVWVEGEDALLRERVREDT